jgi:alkylhydroperoxidase family enzyme
VARIRYPDPTQYEREPLAERIKRERGGKVLNLYRMLLHSPPVAEGWLAFFSSIRQKAALPGRYRELAILRVAVLNGADYEFEAHVPFALNEGWAQAAVDALRVERVPEGLVSPATTVCRGSSKRCGSTVSSDLGHARPAPARAGRPVHGS